MEIRILTIEEMPQALQIARGVFDYCLRKSVPYGDSVAAFETYVKEEPVRRRMEEGSLVLWGAFEQGYLVAMSGMQREGHITMLYVLPVYQRRGCGRELLLAMRKYAWSRYSLPAVTGAGVPAWTSSYFGRRKFTAMNPMQANGAPFVYMKAKSVREISYEKKPIPAGVFLATVLGGTAACTAVAFLFMATYLL